MGVASYYIPKKIRHDTLKYTKKAHDVYSLHYHLVFVVKYRQNVRGEDHEIINFMKTTFEDISEEYGVEIEEMECGTDQVHVLVSTQPTLSMPKYINALNSSRSVRNTFHDFLQYKPWGDHLWTSRYFIATMGNVSIDVLKHYIENQKRRDN